MLIEKGKGPPKRCCPMNSTHQCVQCRPCNILSGIGGAGLFSDGKLNYIHKLGKTDLTQFLPESVARALIDETEKIFNRFGMDGPVYPSSLEAAMQIRKKAKMHGIDLLIIRQKHLGSDTLPSHIAAMSDYIRSRNVVMRTSEQVRDVIVKSGQVRGVVTNRNSDEANNVILALGR